jgi:prolyl-tRNA editing enzyme YbaK/EbsC (Cys-tRNA(Pro) deacylase)
MTTEAIPNAIGPKWQQQLGLQPNDSALPKLAAVSKLFSDLILPIHALLKERRDDAFRRELQRRVNEDRAENPEEQDFKYGEDYFFGKYKGRPLNIAQNAANAMYEGRQGVEMWRIMKSVAFATADKKLVIAHVRGDRQVDTAGLASILGVNETDLTSANEEMLASLGVEHGTVNPFVPVSSQVSHVFDRDLVSGADYPGDDTVFTSSGDPRFFVAFDVRRYLVALDKTTATMATVEISKDESESSRIVARRPVTVIGGDSGIDADNFSKSIKEIITRKLQERGAYFGDRSLPDVATESNRNLAGSIDTEAYGDTLRVEVGKIVEKLKKSLEPEKPIPIVTFRSMAMHGIAADILRDAKGIEYVGPQEAIGQELIELAKRDVEVAHTMLLGLDSVYDKDRSAFAGDILGKALPVNVNVRRSIQELVQDCKTDQGNPEKFYKNVIDTVLRQTTKGQIDTLKNKNVAIILGASELESFISTLESFANTDEKVQATFAVITSNDPAAIATEAAKAPDKIRLILIQPGQAVADMIAQKTLGLEA